MIREAQQLMQADQQDKHTSVSVSVTSPLTKPEYLDKLVQFEKTKQDEGV